MKDIFPEFYINKNKLDFSSLDSNVLVVFDTNVLLDLYRGSSKYRDELKKSIEIVKGNVWMPYQVGHEFHENRKELMHEIQIDRNNFMKNLDEKFDDFFDSSINLFKSKYKLYEEIIKVHEKDFESIKTSFKKETNKISSEIKQKELVDYIDFLEMVFKGKVACNKEYEYVEWETEAKERYDILQPPGYKDYKDKKNEYTFINGIRLCKAYGDFFLWKEMLLKSKDEAIKEVVFITNDEKEDWVYETKGKKIGARMELVEEMMRKSSANFRIYSTSSFLYHTSSEKNYKSIKNEADYLYGVNNRLKTNMLIDEEYMNNKAILSQLGIKLSIREHFKKLTADLLERILLIHEEFNETFGTYETFETYEIENRIRKITGDLFLIKDELENVKDPSLSKDYLVILRRIDKKIKTLEYEILLK